MPGAPPEPLHAQTAGIQAAHPGVRVEQTGGPSIGKGVEKLRGEDLSRTEVIALPVTLITLLVVFGSVSLAVVPLLLALTSITAAVGLSMLASHVFPDAGIGTSVIILIGLAVGVDYTLFYLKREREERARSGGRLSPSAVVELAAATSGRAVVLSGLVARMRRPAAPALTAREIDVLNAVADGLSNADIGRRLVIAEATVKTHLLRVFAKLDVSDRTHAVIVALDRGLITRPEPRPRT